MANMVYANPFGSYVQGKEAGLESAIKQGEAARNFRNNDLNYDFMKWYMPHRQDAALADLTQKQNQAFEFALRNAANMSRITGNFEPANNILAQMYGVSPDTFRQMKPDQLQHVLDTSTGAYPLALDVPGVYMANGVRAVLPGGGSGQSLTERQQLEEQVAVAQLRKQLNDLNNPQSRTIPSLGSFMSIPNQNVNATQTPMATGGGTGQPYGSGGVSGNSTPAHILRPASDAFLPEGAESNPLQKFNEQPAGGSNPSMALYNSPY